MLPSLALHVDLGPDDAAGTGLGLVLALLAADSGFRIPVGGARSITNALLRRLEEGGGQVQLNTRAERIIVQQGRAVAVRTQQGEEIAVRKAGGQWATIGQNLTPDYHVVSGIRRMSTQRAEPLKAAGVELTPEVIEKNRWYAFWDAPLVLKPGREIIGPPRSESDIKQASASFHASGCTVKTDGAALQVTFPG